MQINLSFTTSIDFIWIHFLESHDYGLFLYYGLFVHVCSIFVYELKLAEISMAMLCVIAFSICFKYLSVKMALYQDPSIYYLWKDRNIALHQTLPLYFVNPAFVPVQTSNHCRIFIHLYLHLGFTSYIYTYIYSVEWSGF